MKRGNVKLLVFLPIFCLVAFCGAWFLLSDWFMPKELALLKATYIENSKPLQPFALQATNGKIFSEQNLRGHWTVFFFGYTECPHVCPATLTLVRDAWRSFDNHPPANFVFTTVKPKAETVEELKHFLHRFDRRFIGLTGSSQEIDKFKRQMGVFSQQMPQTNVDEIFIDHTAALMIVGPKANLRAIMTLPFSPEELAHDLSELISKG